MGCLVFIIGLALLGVWGFHSTEDWIPLAGWVLVIAGLMWPSEGKK